jgi:hypothetical protein
MEILNDFCYGGKAIAQAHSDLLDSSPVVRAGPIALRLLDTVLDVAVINDMGSLGSPLIYEHKIDLGRFMIYALEDKFNLKYTK